MSFSLPFWIIIFCLIGRALNILICTFLANLTRDEKTKIGPKRQFFLWFAGVRGAMAFALAIKSKFDFPGVGSMFLLLTLIITAFTLVYSSFLLEDTLYKCDIIVKEGEDQDENARVNSFLQKTDTFAKIKQIMYNIHIAFLLPFVERKENINEHPLKENLNKDFENY